MDRNPPHRGELHPDGDELLYLITSELDVVIEEGGTRDAVGRERVHRLEAGDAILVPKGQWHRVDINGPVELLHVTPGPASDHRPLD